MGGYTGKYSRSPFSTFDEEKNYPFALMQEGIPVTDDDQNASRLGQFTSLRRSNQLFGNYGTPNNGFRVQEATSKVNNFKVTGGGPGNTNIEAAGRFFMRGIACILLKDVDYLNARSDIAEQSIHPRITNVYFDGTDTVVEDSAANWGTNELASRQVKIGSIDHTIASNGQDFFKISGDQTADIDNLDYYILLLTPPGVGTREDAVYLNVYIDEYDENDDTSISKRIGGQEVVAQLRAKIIQTLFVRQDNPTWGDLSDYVDSNGNQHYVFKLAKIDRDTSNNIDQADITDYVQAIGVDNVNLGDINPLKALEQGTPNNTVYVNPGQAIRAGSEELISWAGGTSPEFDGEAVNKRYDALVLAHDGNLDIIKGTPHATTPVIPTMTGHGIPIAYVYVDSNPAVINTVDITDARALFSPPTTWKVLDPNSTSDVATQITSLGLSAGSKFWLPPGQYTLSSTLTINQSGVIIEGSGQSVISMGSNYIHIDTVNDCRIRGVTLTSTAPSTNDMILIDDAARVVIHDVVFNKTSSNYRQRAIRLTAGAFVNDIAIERCTFDQVVNDSTNPASFIYFEPFTDTGLRVTIRDCLFTYAAHASTYKNIVGIDMDSTSFSEILVDNCHFIFSQSDTSRDRIGISIDGTTKIVITHCVFTGYATSTAGLNYGVYGVTGDYINIAHNKFIDIANSVNIQNASTALEIDTNEILIIDLTNTVPITAISIAGQPVQSVTKGNIIYASGRQADMTGISFYDTETIDNDERRVTIIDNEISLISSGGTPTAYGIRILAPNNNTDKANLTINRNKIHLNSTTEDGIVLEGVTTQTWDYLDISGNNILGHNTRYGISIETQIRTTRISGNTINSAGTSWTVGIRFVGPIVSSVINSNVISSATSSITFNATTAFTYTAIVGNSLGNDPFAGLPGAVTGSKAALNINGTQVGGL